MYSRFFLSLFARTTAWAIDGYLTSEQHRNILPNMLQQQSNNGWDFKEERDRSVGASTCSKLFSNFAFRRIQGVAAEASAAVYRCTLPSVIQSASAGCSTPYLRVLSHWRRASKLFPRNCVSPDDWGKTAFFQHYYAFVLFSLEKGAILMLNLTLTEMFRR